MIIYDYAHLAANANDNKAKQHLEQIDKYRSQFQRDRDRIIHANAFRRLEYKTQVFVNFEGDHYRNRLTHTLEVMSIARTLAKALNVSENLTESIACAHDLGHTPFGHAGEEALNSAMVDYNGFDHNAHSLKIVTKLEHKYAAFNGLNLSWYCLEGIAKHNGPVTNNIPYYLQEFNKIYDLKLDEYPTLEAQLASVADDIAYHAHDIEDGVRARLFTLEEICSEVSFFADIVNNVKAKYSNLELTILVYESIRELMHKMVEDVIENTIINIKASKVKQAQDIAEQDQAIVEFSANMLEVNKQIKAFLFKNMYKHPKVNKMSFKAKHIVSKLFETYINNPECLPLNWQTQFNLAADKISKAQIIADFIAGMTDRFATTEYETLFLTTNKIL